MDLKKWTKINDIKAKIESKWNKGEILRNSLEENNLFPLKIALKVPTSQEFSLYFMESLEWIQSLKREAKKKNSYELLEKEINFRIVGKNKIPTHVIIPTKEVALHLIQKEAEEKLFLMIADEFINIWPQNEDLRNWIYKYPFKIINHVGKNFSKLIAIIRWFEKNPRPNLYIRQLDIPEIDTKFMESHKPILEELFKILLPEESMDLSKKEFEDKFYLKRRETIVRFRILDETYQEQKFKELSIPFTEFKQWNPKIENIFFTENEVNFLAFPNYKNSIVIFGRGYGITLLREVEWLSRKKLYYWGDLDTHGFNILSTARAFFPHLKSFAMTEEILLGYKELWVEEERQWSFDIKYLTKEESDLAIKLQNNFFGKKIRLEQERIPFHVIKKHIEKCLHEI
ncbi:hypothetical protein FUSO6_09720 [Fusobacterium necrophorum DAB]|nr:hypothetical protein FUSO6_09720 [Fusobacterium necrophorum DAB]